MADVEFEVGVAGVGKVVVLELREAFFEVFAFFLRADGGEDLAAVAKAYGNSRLADAARAAVDEDLKIEVGFGCVCVIAEG